MLMNKLIRFAYGSLKRTMFFLRRPHQTSRSHRLRYFITLFVLFVLVSVSVIIYNYTVFDVIPDEDIVDVLLSNDINSTVNVCKISRIVHESNDIEADDSIAACSSSAIQISNSTWTSSLIIGGEWHPIECAPRFTVAIVIPYRDRSEHLNHFLRYMHPFLQRQNLRYKIYVIEQYDDKKFNRGKLFNVGFNEVTRDYPYRCFIFHDVDLMPQNMNNVYACTVYPRHMSSSINTFNYKIPYDRNFGGVISISATQFKAVNGFSNRFFGWGGEDDDFFDRIRNYGLNVFRFSQRLSRYCSLSHKPADRDDDRFVKWSEGRQLYDTDGLNSLQYKTVKRIEYLTHTRIFVAL